MKKSLLLLLSLLLSIQNFAQNQKAIIDNNKIIIPINTELKFNVKNNDGKLTDFELIDEAKIETPIDMMEVLKNAKRRDIISAEIDFKFSQADMMGSKIIVLTTLQHFTFPIIFKAKIRLKGKSDYIETSIVQVQPNVFSFEQWQNDIDSIILYDLKRVEK